MGGLMSTDDPTPFGAQLLFQGAACGLVVTREDGTILRANQTFAGWIGRQPAELHGQRFQELLTMGGRIFHQTHWAPLMQMQGSVAEVKLEVRHRDQSTVTMLLNGIRRKHGEEVLHELALFSTTDRDKYEKELLSARKVAERLLEEKTAADLALRQAQAELNVAYEKAQLRALFAEQMVAIVSHDLKNPLTAIKMASDMMARGERSSRDTQLLGHIKQSSERAQRMINDLLDFAQARVGVGIGIAAADVDLHRITAQIVDELRFTFSRAVLVHQRMGSGIARLDADRLQQVIGNLVGNSAAYGDLERPITITSVYEDGVASVSVHNEGPVIPASVMEGLFEPMTRGSESESDVRSVGLGLFIVREIARAHGGDVSVRSSDPGGTTFTVRVPLA